MTDDSKSNDKFQNRNAKGMSKPKAEAFWHLSFGFDLNFELWHLTFHLRAFG